MLPERKRNILKAIVESYIDTAEPVGSKTLAGHFSQPLSSATIRNEMSELEELGYLEKPHVSAGRVPSYQAYRLYVNELMDSYRMAKGEIDRLQRELRDRMRELDNIMLCVSRVASRLTDHTAVSMLDRRGGKEVRKIELVSIGDRCSFAAVAVTSHSVENRVLRVYEPVSDEEAAALTKAVNLALAERKLAQLPEVVRCHAGAGSGMYQLCKKVVEFIDATENAADTSEIYIDGAARLLNNREYHDAEKARDLLNYISDSGHVKSLARFDRPRVVQVKIGPELGDERLRDASFLFSSYDIDENSIGIIGVVAPARMDYARASAQLSMMAETLSELFSDEKSQYRIKNTGEQDERR